MPKAPIYVFFFSSRRRHTRLQGDWSSDVCSSDLSEEIDFFRRLFQIQMRLMTEGVISAIEFFPGEQWSHWDNAKYCKSDRRQECLDHTKTMRDIAAAMIEESMRETPPEGVSVRPAR